MNSEAFNYADIVIKYMPGWDRPDRADFDKALRAAGMDYHRLTKTELVELEQFYEIRRLKSFHLDLPLYTIRKQVERPRRYQAFIIEHYAGFLEARILLVDGLPRDQESSYRITVSANRPLTTDERQRFIDDMNARAAVLSD